MTLLALAACADVPAEPEPPRPVWTWSVDPAFSADERVVLKRSAASWTERGLVRHELVDGPARRRIVRVEGPSPLDAEGGPDWTGHWDAPTRTMSLRAAELAEHEIGHALGLEHVSAGLMGEYAGTWGPDDEAECGRAGACR